LLQQVQLIKTPNVDTRHIIKKLLYICS
jgi:hypothetical protein